mmetsp:Transcript_23554/g.62247  ORF Transcript_23554/g.62247 Transcript_23554/m.62247 type:complete len:284 (+) Transcript_23554:179-1030(+)
MADTQPRAERQSRVSVDVLGDQHGRRMTAAPAGECCRWTPDDTCGIVAADRHEKCTSLHEYLESKMTTHEFTDIVACLGNTDRLWKPSFNGASGNVTLSGGPDADGIGAVVSTYATPFKVTHAAACATTPPTLELQLATHIAGALTIGGSLQVGGAALTAAPTWTNLVLESGYSADGDTYSDTPKWALINGFVHLRGKVCCSPPGSACDANECTSSGPANRIAMMPAAARPTFSQGFLFSATDSPYWSRGGVSGGGTNAGYLQVWTSNNIKSVILDGTVYAPE